MELPDEIYENLIKNKKGNFHQMESPRKLMGKVFGIKYYQIFVRARKRIQIPPSQ
jgi:hypothetical protein